MLKIIRQNHLNSKTLDLLNTTSIRKTIFFFSRIGNNLDFLLISETKLLAQFLWLNFARWLSKPLQTRSTLRR